MLKFNVSLDDDDWDRKIGGWRCDALLIPDVEIDSLYCDGVKVDSKHYSIENYLIRWSSSNNKPKHVSLLLSISENLINIEKEKLKLEEKNSLIEKEKLELEKKNSSFNKRISIASILTAIITSGLTFGATYYLKFSQVKINPPRIHTYYKNLNISEDHCVNELTKKLSNYGLTDITSVKGGVYGIKEQYNVFAGCNSPTKTISVIVAGVNDIEAKQIRDDIKSFLP